MYFAKFLNAWSVTWFLRNGEQLELRLWRSGRRPRVDLVHWRVDPLAPIAIIGKVY